MVGIKGFGMASLATVLVKMGKHVTGSDVGTYFTTDDLLDELQIKRLVGFDASHVPADTDIVITTGAHGGLHNPEVDEARSRGIQIYTHAEALGLVMDSFEKRIAICGCHGKTTSSAMCAYVMHQMGLPLGYQVGASSFSGLPGGDYTGTDYMVVESDEYVASPGIDNTPRFLFQNPTHTLCLNIDLDHVDVYPDLDAVKMAFQTFFEKIASQDGQVVYCYDNESARKVAQNVIGLHIRSYGTDMQADVKLAFHDGQGTVTFEDGRTYDLRLRLPGKHNLLNATGVLTIIDALGLDCAEAVKHLQTFAGAKLRYEVLLDTPDYTVINDYAHHPREIHAVIEATRSQYPDRRLKVLFQPHTVSRTKMFQKEFVEELAQADEAVMLDIFQSAREPLDENFTSAYIVEQAHDAGHTNIAYKTFESVEADFQSYEKGDVIVWLGAGDKKYLYTKLVDYLKSR